MLFFDLHLIESEVIEPMLGRRLTKPTKAKYRRLARVPKYCRYCPKEKADMAAGLVAVACMRLEYPNKPLSYFDVLAYVVQNREKIMRVIAGCQIPVALNLDAPIGVNECIGLLLDRTGQRVSQSTLRRWCSDLGIAFYVGVEIEPFDVNRLLEHCKRLQRERVDRGRRMGIARRDSVSEFKYCEAM